MIVHTAGDAGDYWSALKNGRGLVCTLRLVPAHGASKARFQSRDDALRHQ
jgi:hypothetical protein